MEEYMDINDLKKMSLKKMSEILNVGENDIIGDSPLDDWLRKLCNKRYYQLDCQDVTTMFNQNVGVDFAAFKAFELLADDPICGLHDWQLLELISQNKDRIKDALNKYFD